MSKATLALTVLAFISHAHLASSAPIAGVDFSDTVVFDDPDGGDDLTPDDLDVTDSITVSDWSFAGGGKFEGVDNNSNSTRPSPPVRKMNGEGTNPKPAVGTAPPTVNEHSFSIVIPSGMTLDLTHVKFNFSNATDGEAPRWLAFRTSLDANIIWSEFGVKRPEFPAVDIVLSGAQYEGLTGTTITFYWYAGKEPDNGDSGDIDIDTILIEGNLTSADSDNDTLPDVWEQQIITFDSMDAFDDVFDVLPGDDFDMDDASNFKEFTDGTNPTNPDSDGDDLSDGHETNDGSFDSATDTGSNPLKADTDGDTIDDGDEVNGVGGFVTDPNKKDTDGDFFPDNVELDLGSDPTKIDDIPTPGTKLLFIGNADAPEGADADVMTFLEDRYGAANVTYQPAGTTDPGDEYPFGVLVISSTIGSGDARGRFNNTPVPVVNWEEAVADNGAGEFMITAGRQKETAASHTITITADHPITEGFAIGQDVIISDTETEIWYSNGQQAPGSLSLAEKMGDSSYLYLTTVDKGGELNDASFAQARRVMFGLSDASFTSFTDDGKTLFGQAVDWALGISPAETGMRITDISYTRTTAPENVVVDITFTSEEGKAYTLFRSDNFDEPADTRPDVRDDIQGAAGATTTTFSVDFNAESIPLDTLRQFFVVQENPSP